MLDSFKLNEDYRDHEITVATWPMRDGCDCSFSIQPPLDAISGGSTVIRCEGKFSCEDEARRSCLNEARRLVDEKLARNDSATDSAPTQSNNANANGYGPDQSSNAT